VAVLHDLIRQALKHFRDQGDSRSQAFERSSGEFLDYLDAQGLAPEGNRDRQELRNLWASLRDKLSEQERMDPAPVAPSTPREPRSSPDGKVRRRILPPGAPEPGVQAKPDILPPDPAGQGSSNARPRRSRLPEVKSERRPSTPRQTAPAPQQERQPAPRRAGSDAVRVRQTASTMLEFMRSRGMSDAQIAASSPGDMTMLLGTLVGTYGSDGDLISWISENLVEGGGGRHDAALEREWRKITKGMRESLGDDGGRGGGSASGQPPGYGGAFTESVGPRLNDRGAAKLSFKLRDAARGMAGGVLDQILNEALQFATRAYLGMGGEVAGHPVPPRPEGVTEAMGARAVADLEITRDPGGRYFTIRTSGDMAKWIEYGTNGADARRFVEGAKRRRVARTGIAVSKKGNRYYFRGRPSAGMTVLKQPGARSYVIIPLAQAPIDSGQQEAFDALPVREQVDTVTERQRRYRALFSNSKSQPFGPGLTPGGRPTATFAEFRSRQAEGRGREEDLNPDVLVERQINAILVEASGLKISGGLDEIRAQVDRLQHNVDRTGEMIAEREKTAAMRKYGVPTRRAVQAGQEAKTLAEAIGGDKRRLTVLLPLLEKYTSAQAALAAQRTASAPKATLASDGKTGLATRQAEAYDEEGYAMDVDAAVQWRMGLGAIKAYRKPGSDKQFFRFATLSPDNAMTPIKMAPRIPAFPVLARTQEFIDRRLAEEIAGVKSQASS
jgi:hypothetical protein